MDNGSDIAANVAKQAVSAMMGSAVSEAAGVLALLAAAAGLVLLAVLLSRKRRRRPSGRSRRPSRGKRKRR